MHLRCALAVTAVGIFGVVACGGGDGSSIDCSAVTGQTVTVDVDGDESIVYLPPCHDAEAELPSAYLLHGAGMSPGAWLDPPISAVQQLDELIATGDIAPLVVVFPSRATMPSGFGARVLDPLVAEVESQFGAATDPDRRAIGGFSAGGPPAAIAAFDAEARVAALGLFAPVWTSVVTDAVVTSFGERSDPPSARIDVGDRDALGRNAPIIEDVLAGLGADVELTVVPGGHDFSFVAERLPAWMRWFDAELSG